MNLKKNPEIDVLICADILQMVFDECDRYDHDETGGRVLGTFRQDEGEKLVIKVNGVIESGPNARRSASSFFQDGEYQAQVFREIERTHPNVEHLGNWHTHHVNGYPTLSNGDIETYRRIVNHQKHNLNFFYALLVVKRNNGASDLERYRIRHYVLFRSDDRVHEVNPEHVSVIDEPVIWPTITGSPQLTLPSSVAVRAKDKSMIENLYPEIRPYQSKRTSMFYWRGILQLIDGSVVRLTIPELTGDDEQCPRLLYQVSAKNLPKICIGVAEQFGEQHFRSAAEAIHKFEQRMNKTLYQTVSGKKEVWLGWKL